MNPSPTNLAPMWTAFAWLCIFPCGILILPLFVAPVFMLMARQAQDAYNREIDARSALRR